jgi:hypothetical protein
VGDSAAEEVEKVEGLTKDRFVALDRRRGAGGRPAGGAQGARSRNASVRRCSGLGEGAVVLGRS